MVDLKIIDKIPNFYDFNLTHYFYISDGNYKKST